MPKETVSLKTKKLSQNKSRKLPLWQRWPAWNILGVVFGGGLVLIIVGLIIAQNITGYLQNQADKEKFAKIESLVNNVTTDLKKTYPDKNWQTVKYCQASRGEFGNIIAISCTYGVKGPDGTTIEELSPVVGRHVTSLGVFEDTGGGGMTKYEAYSTPSLSARCETYPSGVGLLENFGCTSGSESFLYPETPR